jgi:hypothetical protein
LVHHNSGRVPGASLAALSRMRLHDRLADELTNRLNIIGSDYVAIHIRNTDYQTDYRSLLTWLKTQDALSNCGKLFVATDDIRCLEVCRTTFPEVKVFSFAKLPDEPGRPMHRLSEQDEAYQRNKDAILDLLMLALSRQYAFTSLKENRWRAKYSGYSVLAFELRDSKTTLDRLLCRSGRIDPIIAP